MSTSGRTLVPESIEAWAGFVRDDPNIEEETPQFTSVGRERDLSVTDTTYNSGSGITGSEFLHLRVIWTRYRQVNDLGNMIRDDPSLDSPYRGYVSSQNLDLADKIYSSRKGEWQAYLEDIKDDRDNPRPAKECRDWRAVRYWQSLVLKHTKKDDAVSEEQIKRASKVQTCQRSKPVLPNVPLGTPSPAPGRSPFVPNYAMGTGNPSNTPTADEAYANTALLLLLQAATMSVDGVFSDMHWVAPRIPLKLTATKLHAPQYDLQSSTKIEYLQAQVDGYLCRRQEDGKMTALPLAICEAKPFVRKSALASIRRQEGAEMACWINRCRDDTGLLRSSVSGRKRRLLISQDRHEIYIVVGEYGSKYEKYIRPVLDPRLQKGKASQSKKPSTGDGATAEERAGSAGYNNQIKDKRVKIEGADKTITTKSARVAAKAADPNLPRADEFLFMHEFGPFLTNNNRHMEVFIRRLIGLMLELKAGAIRSDPPRPQSLSGAGPSGGATTSNVTPMPQSSENRATRLPIRSAVPSSSATTQPVSRTINTRSSARRDDTEKPQPPLSPSLIPKPSPKKKTGPKGSTGSGPKQGGGPSSSSGPITPAQQQPQARERPQMTAAEKVVHTELLRQNFSEPRADFLEQEPIRGVKKARSLPKRNVTQDQPWENFERR